jgi:FHS family L-fucose permease-like MFS transporter
LLQGWAAADNVLGISASYWVGVLCFVYLAYYALKASSELKSQGFSLDNTTVTGGGH